MECNLTYIRHLIQELENQEASKALLEFGMNMSYFNKLSISKEDLQKIHLIYENFYLPYIEKPEFMMDKNSCYLKLHFYEQIDEIKFFQKIDFLIFANFSVVFNDFDKSIKDHQEWIQKYGTFKYAHLKKLCLAIYSISRFIFSKFDTISYFQNFLKIQRENVESGFFEYFSSRFSFLLHPDLICSYSDVEIYLNFRHELEMNLQNPPKKINFSVFDSEDIVFADLLKEFLTSSLNLPYFALITSMKYLQREDNAIEMFYFDGNGTDFSKISNERMEKCEILLKNVLENIQDKIYFVAGLQGKTRVKIMHQRIFIHRNNFIWNIENYNSIEKESVLFRNEKAFFMVLLAHEIAHKICLETSPELQFLAPNKKKFESKNPIKPHDVGVGWEFFLANQKIHENDFWQNNKLSLLFTKKENWNLGTFKEEFEKHRQTFVSSDYDEKEEGFICGTSRISIAMMNAKKARELELEKNKKFAEKYDL